MCLAIETGLLVSKAVLGESEVIVKVKVANR